MAEADETRTCWRTTSNGHRDWLDQRNETLARTPVGGGDCGSVKSQTFVDCDSGGTILIVPSGHRTDGSAVSQSVLPTGVDKRSKMRPPRLFGLTSAVVEKVLAIPECLVEVTKFCTNKALCIAIAIARGADSPQAAKRTQ